MKILLKILLLAAGFFQSLNATGFSQDYYNLHLDKQKDYFLNYFKNRIKNENLNILNERIFLQDLNGKKNLDENSVEYTYLKTIAKKYKVKDIYDYKELLKRVDIVPPSLALAQAATESGWGKSRFFKEANNIFGHWTFNPKVGLKPLDRDKDKKHFVKIFPNLQSSIASYMRNLNRTRAYKEFRDFRKKFRDEGTLINGLELSTHLHRYSGIGHDYVSILKAVITKNNLLSLDENFYNMIKGYK